MRPSNKTWSLTVRGNALQLDAPHGSFEVRGIAPEVVPVVAALPDGVEVECEGSFDGGGTITHLVVTKVRRILKDMSGRVMELPDAIVAADGRLAAARARKHFDAGRVGDAARDVGFLLSLGDDQAIGEFDRLPGEHRHALLDALAEWQAKRKAMWRALRHLPLDRWTHAHLEQAVEQGLTNGGVFGAAPGVRVEDVLEELERRKLPTTTLAKQTQRLRRAQATEGDTFFRVFPDVDEPRVVGADAAGVYVAGYGGEGPQPVIVHLDHEGRELKRWIGAHADRVVEGVALQIEAAVPAAMRLSDGKPLFTFAHRIEHHDGELLWGVHVRDPIARVMHSEIRHIATGYTIATFHDWVDDVTWNAQHIFVYGRSPLTLTREGRLVRAEAPPRPSTLTIETAAGPHTIPAAHAPWLFGDWRSSDAGGWIVHHRWRQLYLAPSEPGATWVNLELASNVDRVDVAPPWLVVQPSAGPILLVALAEAMSAQQIRIDGKRFARRGRTGPALDVPQDFIRWYETLEAAGVTPRSSEVERDAWLFRMLGTEKHLPEDALSRVLVGHSPYCIDHAYYYVDNDDDVFDRLTRLFSDEGIAIRELARRTYEELEETEADPPDDEVTLTLQVSRGDKTLERRCGWRIDHVILTLDKMLDEIGAQRRLYALIGTEQHRRAYLALTADQRRALIAAGVQGIRGGPRST